MSYESPISVLVNEDGNVVARSGSQSIPSEQPGFPVMGKDEAGNAQFLHLAADGALKVSASIDIDLDASTDSVSVFNSNGNAFSISNYLPVGLSNGTNLIGDSNATPVYVTGSSFTELFDALMMVSGGVDDAVSCLEYVENAVMQVSGAIDSLGGGLSLVDINTSVGDVNSSVLAVSGAIAELISTTLASSATITSMLAVNGSDSVASLATRKGFIFFLEGSNTAYVKFGAGASSSDYSITIIGPGGFYELSSLRYTGELSVAFKNTTGLLRITELT